MTFKFAAAALVAGLLAAPAQAAVNLVTNGSFESGINPGGYTTVNAFNNTAISGWEVGVGSVDYIGTYWQASDGNRSIDLNGNSLGWIAQLVSGLVVGQSYQLKFDIAGNPDGGPTIKTLKIGGFGGATTSFDTTGHSLSAMGWEQRSYTFIATSTNIYLSFESTVNSPCCFGAAIDNVSVSAVPEPATWAMMLIGFAGLGYAARRRVRAAAAA